MDLTRRLNMILGRLKRRTTGADDGPSPVAEHSAEERQHAREVHAAAMRARHDLHLTRETDAP